MNKSPVRGADAGRQERATRPKRGVGATAWWPWIARALLMVAALATATPGWLEEFGSTDLVDEGSKPGACEVDASETADSTGRRPHRPARALGRE